MPSDSKRSTREPVQIHHAGETTRLSVTVPRLSSEAAAHAAVSLSVFADLLANRAERAAPAPDPKA